MRTRDGKIQRLQRVELLSGLRVDELRRVAKLAEGADVPAGWVLAHEEAPAREFVIVVSGSAVLTTRAGDVRIIGAGSCIGDAALLTDGVHRYTVVSLTPMEVFAFEARAFHGLLDRSPAVVRRIMKRLTSDLRTLQGSAPLALAGVIGTGRAGA